MMGHDVGYWHLADIAAHRLRSAFGGKADMHFGCRCPLLTHRVIGKRFILQ